MLVRRGKWNPFPPPPTTPRILQLPRRGSRYSRPSVARVPARKSPPSYPVQPCGNLGELFHRDRSFNRGRRARVESRTPSPPSALPPWVGGGREDSEEERWKLEAEVLRAECDFLRMDREVALQKIESNRVQMEAALRSAVQTLVSGRKKIDGVQGLETALEEEIGELQSKLDLLERRSRRRRSSKSCSSIDLKPRGKGSAGRNFDKKAMLLRKRLEEMAVKASKTASTSRRCEDQEEVEESCVREIREIASEGTNISHKEKPWDGKDKNVVVCGGGGLLPDWRCQLHEVEILWRKMEGMSNVMLQRMEQCTGCLPASPLFPSSSPIGLAGRIIAANPRAGRLLQPARTEKGSLEIGERVEEEFCSGRCRAVVGKIMEQVRAETEQWNTMRGMLEQVRREMEDLQCARDYWERCAVASDAKLRAATTQMLEWKRKAQASEQRVSELHTQVRQLQVETGRLRMELSSQASAEATTPPSPSKPRLRRMDPPRRIKCQHAPPLPTQQLLSLKEQMRKDKENQLPLLRARECHPASRAPSTRRPPLRQIGNASISGRT